MTTKTTESGLLLVDKPSGWTSHDVVGKVRTLAGTRRVGHAGTLDPMATGLLILGINSATKLLTFLVGATKTYLATIRLGSSTVTDDAEGEVTSVADSAKVASIGDEQIREGIRALTGRLSQVPSSVSAIKVNGERAYAKVRAGDEVQLAAREVEVSRFDLLAEPKRFEQDGSEVIDLEVLIDCSSGTYIRALARDLGKDLGIGGHLTALRRTRVGGYLVEDAMKLDAVPHALPIVKDSQAVVGSFSIRRLTDQEVVDLRHGKRIELGQIDLTSGGSREGLPLSSDSPVAAISDSGELVAMLERTGKQLKSSVVFASTDASGAGA